jgi:poly(hydroxyalkanoate) depolymerase family esterase
MSRKVTGIVTFLCLIGCGAGERTTDAGGRVAAALDAGVSVDAGAFDAGLATDAGVRPTTGWQWVPDGAEGAWLYVPRNGALPLPALVLLHGCTQTARDFATATNAEDLAERDGVVLLLPQQSLLANAARCWSWWSPQEQAGTGPEVQRIATHVAQLPRLAAVDPARVYVAGLSAGAAMTSILGATHPELVHGLAVHSGVAYAAAQTATGALLVQDFGASDVPSLSEEAFHAMSTRAHTLPVLVFHGTLDTVVAPINGGQVEAQWRGTNDWVDDGLLNDSLPAGYQLHETVAGRDVTIDRVERADGKVLLERWTIGGVGHAWSGGAPGQAFTAPGPDALGILWDFFTTRAAQ